MGGTQVLVSFLFIPISWMIDLERIAYCLCCILFLLCFREEEEWQSGCDKGSTGGGQNERSLQQSSGRARMCFEGQRKNFELLKIETIIYHSLSTYQMFK